MSRNKGRMRRKLYPGDIIAMKGRGIAGWLSKNLMIPHTDRYHFRLVGWPVCRGGYLVFESSTSKGPTFGLFWLDKAKDAQIYRLNLPEARQLGKKVVRSILKYGGAHYDYLLALKLLLSAFRLLLRGNWPPWEATEFHYTRDSRFNCTELVNEGYMAVGKPIVPYGVPPLPSEFARAIEQRKLIRIL